MKMYGGYKLSGVTQVAGRNQVVSKRPLNLRGLLITAELPIQNFIEIGKITTYIAVINHKYSLVVRKVLAKVVLMVVDSTLRNPKVQLNEFRNFLKARTYSEVFFYQRSFLSHLTTKVLGGSRITRLIYSKIKIQIETNYNFIKSSSN